MKHRNNRVRRPIGGNVISAIKFRWEMARRYARSARAWAGRATGLWRQRPMAYYERIDPASRGEHDMMKLFLFVAGVFLFPVALSQGKPAPKACVDGPSPLL